MTCDAPIRKCLAWHIAPKINGRVEKDGYTIRAHCPSCGAAKALTISAGQNLRATWNCYGVPRCGQAELRGAIIRAGVEPGCLPRSRAMDRTTSAVIVAVLQQGTKADRAQTCLRVYLIAQGHVRWPTGKELEKLAGEIGVSKTDAYRAKRAGALVPSPRTPVPRQRS